MSVSCGIVGLPNVGKSTLFSALSAAGAEVGNFPFCTVDPNVAVVEVPDDRLQRIAAHIDTAKIVPAAVRIVDIAGLVAGASKGEGMGNQFLANIRECDAVMHVVRCFGGERVIRESPVDPVGDADVVELELALADLETVRKGGERHAKRARTGDRAEALAAEVCAKAGALLEDGVLLHQRPWSDAERAVLAPLCLLTMKPILYVANVADDDPLGEGALPRALAEYARERGSGWLPICGDLELELRRMDAEDRAAFMEELGIPELGLSRLVQEVYRLLGLQTFFTAGPKEVRAWAVPREARAPQAAGVIHSDFEKQFIRAEVYSVDDLEELGSEAAIRAAGRMRTEGRDYRMREGDVAHFLVGK